MNAVGEYTYTGRRLDPITGLMYFRARYYDPQTGEFISRDPLGYVDGMSQYRGYFVPGGVDPFGLEKLVAYIKDGVGVFPVYRNLLRKCYYHTQVNGKPFKVRTVPVQKVIDCTSMDLSSCLKSQKDSTRCATHVRVRKIAG